MFTVQNGKLFFMLCSMDDFIYIIFMKTHADSANYMYGYSPECMGSTTLPTPHPFLLTSYTRAICTKIPFFNIHSQHNGGLSHIDCGWIKSTWCRVSLIRRVF